MKKYVILEPESEGYIMTNLTSVINVNVPVEVKEEANNIFNSLGINMSTAINMFLKKTIYERGIPFDLKNQPAQETMEAYQELYDMERGNIEYKKYHNVKEMFEEILNDK